MPSVIRGGSVVIGSCHVMMNGMENCFVVLAGKGK